MKPDDPDYHPLVNAAAWGFLGLVIGAFVAGWYTIRAERLRAERVAELDKEQRLDNRRLDRDQFQRKTLLALQEAANDLSRATTLVHLHDVDAFESTKKWRHAVVAEGVAAAAALDARRAVSTLKSNVADKRVRDLAAQLLEAAGTVASSTDREVAVTAEAKTTELLSQLMERSGDSVQKTFVDDEITPRGV
jgi:hypothetical protein